MSNTRLWDVLGKTDPSHTKGFKRAGGFSGTAIKPMWSFRRMTEQFGPCGLGWGVNEPSFQVVPGCDGEVLVYCTVSVWYGEGTGDNERNCVHSPIFGVGGDKVVVKQTSGLRSDDEAFKKAYTDAIGNALKLIGVGADVHMGLFDDSKYVNEMRQEFAEDKSEPVADTPQPPKRFGKNESRQTYADLQKVLDTAPTLDELKMRWESSMPIIKTLPVDWEKELAVRKDTCKAALMKAAQGLNQIQAPDFSHLEPNDLDPIEELIGRTE